MSDMKHIKVVASKWAGYTGALGRVMFKDGVSVDPLPRHLRDRMAAAMEFTEIDEDGSEQPAGAAHRMIREYAERAAPVTILSRQTEGEKQAEISASQVASLNTPALVTRAELEEIVSKGGIKALREVANKWNVRHRAIPTLIDMVLDAQSKAVDKLKKIDQPTPVETPVAEDPTADAEIPEDVAEADARAAAEVKAFEEAEALKAAAASGDLGAALDAEAAEEAVTGLYGSSVLASSYEIEGKTVTLGEIVRGAFERSGATVEEWNALAGDDREDLLRLELDRLLPKE